MGLKSREKGVNVVQFQDGSAQALKSHRVGIRATLPRFLSASAAAKLGPRDGDVVQ